MKNSTKKGEITISDIPPVNPDHLQLQVGELVVLKPEHDDKNMKRVYKIIRDYTPLGSIDVEVISEKPVDGYKSMDSLVGRVFFTTKEYFKPYL